MLAGYLAFELLLPQFEAHKHVSWAVFGQILALHQRDAPHAGPQLTLPQTVRQALVRLGRPRLGERGTAGHYNLPFIILYAVCCASMLQTLFTHH